MRVTRGLDTSFQAIDRAVVIGSFDGVHIGHQYLIRHTCGEAAARGLEATAFTFEPVPQEVFSSPSVRGVRLTTEDERLELLNELCVDHLVVADFNEDFRKMSAEEFARDILVAHLHTKLLIAAETHTFGHYAEADVNAIRALGDNYGFAVLLLPLLKMDNLRVSSTSVRNYLWEAHAEEAAALLARHYSMRGTVVSGTGTGRRMGFPTVNLRVAPNKLIPGAAVYAGLADGHALQQQLGPAAVPCPAAISIGPQPTFGRTQLTIEAHIITDKALDLVGTTLELRLVRRVRLIEQFADAEPLRSQIANDVETIQGIFRHGPAETYRTDHAPGPPQGDDES